jgi:aminobenzoyl-glutamate transport protein
VLPTANYYFMAASTFIIALVGTWVTTAVVEKRHGAYRGDAEEEPMHPLTPRERRGRLW